MKRLILAVGLVLMLASLCFAEEPSSERFMLGWKITGIWGDKVKEKPILEAAGFSDEQVVSVIERKSQHVSFDFYTSCYPVAGTEQRVINEAGWTLKGLMVKDIKNAYLDYEYWIRFLDDVELISDIAPGQIFLLVDFIKKHRKQIKIMRLTHAGWFGTYGNNLDMKNFEFVKKKTEMQFYILKAVFPDLPILGTVCVSSADFEWIKMSPPVDGWAVWNIYKRGANFEKIYNRYKNYSPNIVLGGFYGFNPDNKIVTWNDVKKYKWETITRCKEIGYKGVSFPIWRY